MSTDSATPDIFTNLVGRSRIGDRLRAAAAKPVHAFLFLGPPGSGRLRSALTFGAALICPQGGCGRCLTCRRILARTHPDVVVVERTGASISLAQVREIRRVAMRSPHEGSRQVLILVDFHLAPDSAAALLKVLEEPPPSTVFVVIAEHIASELITVASRCVRVRFDPPSTAEIVSHLVSLGAEADEAGAAAAAAGSRFDRAALLLNDADFAARREQWRSVPTRLDGTGATVHRLAEELTDLLTSAGVGSLQAQQAAEVADFGTRNPGRGKSAAAVPRELTDRHKRELRRLRTDELRAGLATMAGAYRDALVTGGDPRGLTSPRRWADAIDIMQATAEALVRNPSELLLLQALLLRLPALASPR